MVRGRAVRRLRGAHRPPGCFMGGAGTQHSRGAVPARRRSESAARPRPGHVDRRRAPHEPVRGRGGGPPVSDRHKDWPARLRLHPTAFVAPGATVVGEVTLGEGASVWFGSVLRGDGAAISIGARSNIQDLSVVHVDEDAPAVVGDRVTVGHRAIVHGCTIEDDCLIGMGAIVLSKAVIGAGSLVGAGALVTERQVVPPGSLVVGSPARVRGPVAASHRAAIEEGARHYFELSRAYLAKGFARGFPPATSAPGIMPGGRGPMTFAEWGGVLAALAENPDWIGERLARAPERARTRPAGERWSALE